MPRPIPFRKSLTVNLSQLKDEFLLARQADGLAPRTLADYCWHIEKFMELTGPNPTYDTIRKALLQHLSEPSSPRYRNIKLQYLRAFFNWCVREGYLPNNPTEGIRKVKEDISNVRHVSIEVVKKLLSQPDKKTYTGLRDYCLMLVQIDTGARPGELLRIKPCD
jgi:integrase